MLQSTSYKVLGFLCVVARYVYSTSRLGVLALGAGWVCWDRGFLLRELSARI